MVILILLVYLAAVIVALKMILTCIIEKSKINNQMADYYNRQTELNQKLSRLNDIFRK